MRRGACFWGKRRAITRWIVPFGTRKSMGSGRGWLFGTSQKAVCTVWRRLCDMEKGLHLPPHRRDRRCIDSLAQQVEHIPFKDGVLGSSPRRITGIQMNKKAKAFHSWTDPQWKAFFRVFSFMSSFSCLDARKGSEKKIKASPRPGKFGRVPGKLGWRPWRPLIQEKEAKRKSRPLPRPGRFGRVPGKLGWRPWRPLMQGKEAKRR